MSDKIKVRYIREPAFYKKFHCIGGECTFSCCCGWDVIGWSKSEYDKIVNAEISNELREIFETSFKPVTNKNFKDVFDYQVNLANDPRCPMLTENGLCMIQKEIGEEYLSATCKIYPRKGFICGNAMVRTCQASCVHVLKTICSDENSMLLENSLHKGADADMYPPNTAKDMLNNPALKYESELFEFFYEILSDRTRSIESSIVLGAMAAQKIDEFVKKGQADKIPQIIKALKPQLNDPAQTAVLEKAKSNLSLKANVAAALVKNLNGANTLYSGIFENGIPSEEKWAEGMEKWNAVFNDRPFAMRNMALDLFIALRMPFRDNALSLFKNFSYFASEICLIKCIAASVSIQVENVGATFYNAVANIDRSFSHNNVNVKKIVDVLHAAGVNSPAYLMGILK